MSLANELERFEPFRAVSAEGRGLLSRCSAHTYPDGETLLSRGQRASGAYVVVSGQLRVYSISPDGTEATIYFLAPGETCVLALNCLFNDLLYPAWVQPVGEVRVAVIPGQIYRSLFETERSIRELTVRALSTLVFRLMVELEGAVTHSQTQRLAQFLLDHASAEGGLKTTQDRLARHLGTSREVIARLLGQLSGEGLVRTGRGLVELRDVEGLRRLLAL